MFTFLRKPMTKTCLKLTPMKDFEQSWVKLSALLLAFFFTSASFFSCSESGGGNSSGNADLSTYTMPTEISAVPVDTDAVDASISFNRSFGSRRKQVPASACLD